MSAHPPRGYWKFTACLLLAGLVVVLDQLVKQAAHAALRGQPGVEVLPFFRLELVFNRGAAFGFLGDAGGWQHVFLAGVAVVVSVVLVGWLWRVAQHPAMRVPGLPLGLALILGGALGNLIDRLGHGYVIDFIVLHYRGWQFPAFNIADAAITIGALLVVLDSLGWPGGRADRRAD